MQGPYPAGTVRPTDYPTTPWEQCLTRGTTYRVVKAFRDADGDSHVPGETWTYLASAFSPYDDELLINVSGPGGSEWSIRMIWTPERHQSVIEAFTEYVSPE